MVRDCDAGSVAARTRVQAKALLAGWGPAERCYAVHSLLLLRCDRYAGHDGSHWHWATRSDEEDQTWPTHLPQLSPRL